MFTLDRKAFEQWLEANADNVVGVPGSVLSCPFSQYIKSTDPNIKKVRTALCYIEVRYADATEHYTTPPWLEQFILRVDMHVFPDLFGKQCLNALKRIP
jgi:hypothetical protein